MNELTSNGRCSDTDCVPFDTSHETHLNVFSPQPLNPPQQAVTHWQGLLDAHVPATATDVQLLRLNQSLWSVRSDRINWNTDITWGLHCYQSYPTSCILNGNAYTSLISNYLNTFSHSTLSSMRGKWQHITAICVWKAMENTERYNCILSSCMKLKCYQQTTTCLHCCHQGKTLKSFSFPQVALLFQTLRRGCTLRSCSVSSQMHKLAKLMQYLSLQTVSPAIKTVLIPFDCNSREDFKDKTAHKWVCSQRSAPHTDGVCKMSSLQWVWRLQEGSGFIWGSFAAGNNPSRDPEHRLTPREHLLPQIFLLQLRFVFLEIQVQSTTDLLSRRKRSFLTVCSLLFSRSPHHLRLQVSGGLKGKKANKNQLAASPLPQSTCKLENPAFVGGWGGTDIPSRTFNLVRSNLTLCF